MDSSTSMMFAICLLFTTYIQLGDALSTSFLHQRGGSQSRASSGLQYVPKIIHQTWKDKQLPPAFENWSKSWQECLPDWEFRLYTDEDNRNYIKQNFPEFLETYDNYDANIKRVDAVRYAYLAVDGGLYVDLDIECLRDPYSLFPDSENGVWGDTDVTLACESSMKESCVTEGQVSNAFMFAGTQAGKDFFRRVVNRLPETQHDLTLWATGPGFLTRQYRDLLTKDMQPNAQGTLKVQDFHTKPYNIKRLSKAPTTVTMVDDSLVFDIGWDDAETKERCMNKTWCKERSPHAMSVSHWSASWLPLISTLESDKEESKGHEIAHSHEDCYDSCNGGGFCDWCGHGNACCRYNHLQDPHECNRAIHFAAPGKHVCVALKEEEPEAIQHPDVDCFAECKAGGLCDWCGRGNACCRQGWQEDAAECKRAVSFFQPYGHVCVSLHQEQPRPQVSFLSHPAIMHKSDMCSCLADSLWLAGTPTRACQTWMKQRLGHEMQALGGDFRSGMWRLEELYEKSGC
mmetsp:Transcript_52484/g.94317  ORF Transcript_52484/g.94317 Transcript_52484/m.94317 type:complete len:515 (-) Transcript_52484:125-1669(-)